MHRTLLRLVAAIMSALPSTRTCGTSDRVRHTMLATLLLVMAVAAAARDANAILELTPWCGDTSPSQSTKG